MATPEPHFPGAASPERIRHVDSDGVSLCLREWGDPAKTPILLCHGMFDHARGFDTLAPLLAERFRVVAIDARGHGDSGWADAYSWPTDIDDIGAVIRDLGQSVHLVGHSKGGGQATDAACWYPENVRSVVNIDGFGPPDEDGFPRPGMPADERTIPERFAAHLDHRQALTSGRSWRTYASLDDLVDRRRRQNPRLSREWLRYFVFHAARENEDGWVWKVDPLAGSGFGPFKPRWIGPGWRWLRVPLLAVVGSEQDTWGPIPEKMRDERIGHAPVVEHAVIEGVGHFTHMEDPRQTADCVLSFVGSL